jgi:hypothetical protein
MIIFKVHPVIPTRGLWLLMMFLIGIFGLIAQVRSLPLHGLSNLILVSLNAKDTSGHGFPEGDSFTWQPRHVYLSVPSPFLLFHVKTSQLF